MRRHFSPVKIRGSLLTQSQKHTKKRYPPPGCLLLEIVTASPCSLFYVPTWVNRELKQQRRRQLRKLHWKSVYPTSFNSANAGKFFSELNSKGLYQSSGKEKESCCLVFPSSTKHEIRHFHVVVVQRRLRNVQKSLIHVQTCCFANLNLLLFCRSRCRRRRRCLSSLIV